ncbi:MAG: ClpXP protease specificity-enhancing factor [Pseudomonadota bacterium]
MGPIDLPSTRPYLIRALYDWCTDNGFTPYVAVQVDHTVQVPREHVKNNEIVLNISFDATSALKLGNEFIEFRARFSGTAREIVVPIDHVIAIYARENGQGMAFPGPSTVVSAGPVPLTSMPAAALPASKPDDRGDGNVVPIGTGAVAPDGDGDPPKPPAGPRPALKRVK